MSEHDETQGETLIGKAKRLGMRPEQLQDANAAGLTARLVAEARRGVLHWEAAGTSGSGPLVNELQQAVSKLIERGVEDREREKALEDRLARLEMIDLSPNESFTDRLKRCTWLNRRFEAVEALPPEDQELRLKVGAMESQSSARYRTQKAVDGQIGDLLLEVVALKDRLVSLEWAAKNPAWVDPLDAAVEAGLLRPDTPETLDPDLSDEAQMEARVKAVTKVIGEAIGVVKGVCRPSAVRAIVSHHLDHAMDAAKDAARVKSP